MSDPKSKTGSRALTFRSLLEAKLAGLAAENGATDGQVGGTWDLNGANKAKQIDPKIDQFVHVSWKRCFQMLLDFWIEN